MTTPLVNTHCHSRLCGHGEGALSAYVDEARRKGLAVLAFTEHFPLTSRFDPDTYLSVPADAWEGYKASVRALGDAADDIDILLGCELDYLGDLEDRTLTPEEFADFDLVLGSVHFIDGWAFDDPAKRDRWEEPGAPDEIWRRYYELWCAAVSDKDAPYQVMAHPDLPKKFAYYPTFDLEPLYAAAAEAAAAAGRMIEVNTSGAYYACQEMFPAPALLSAFCKAGVPATVGTDAHVPANVDRGIAEAYDLLRAAGYRKVTVPGADGERRELEL